MKTKRIIPCLDIQKGRVVKGINFTNIRDVRDPVEAAIAYEKMGADEIVLLNIHATEEERTIFLSLVNQIAKSINIPLTVGGGINSVEDFEITIEAGASKASVNTAAVNNPKLLFQIADKFTSSRLVLAIDAKRIQKNGWEVVTKGGSETTGIDAISWAIIGEKLGVGEILLTSMDGDGVKQGYDIDLTRSVSEKVNIPVIASGGAGKLEHFYEALTTGKADAVLAASLFHFGEISVDQLKSYLKSRNIPVKL